MSTKKTKQQPDQPAETDFHALHKAEVEDGSENAGAGGSYEVRDGKRVLVHRTETKQGE